MTYPEVVQEEKIGFCKQENSATLLFIAEDTVTYRYRITKENLMI